MSGQWLHLAVIGEWDVAVPLAAVSRFLHREDPEFSVWAAGACPIAERLGVTQDPGLPGVVALFTDGSCWLVGDAWVGGPSSGTFHPVPPWLFESQPPWCHGVLVRGQGWSFVADPVILGAFGE